MHKEVFQEINTTDHYEGELNRIMTLGSVEHAVLFYHYACYYFKILKKPFICKDSFLDLCDFIVDNKDQLPTQTKEYVNLEDVDNYACNLTEAPLPSLHLRGKHFINNILELLGTREDTFHIDFSVKRWEEPVVSYH